MNIHPQIKEACQAVLSEVYHEGRFTKREFGYLDFVIQWFDEPDKTISFSFEISLQSGGESQSFMISYENALEIEETHTAYDPQVGSDHYTSYRWFQDDSGYREEGDIVKWRFNALDALRFIDHEERRVEIRISYEERDKESPSL